MPSTKKNYIVESMEDEEETEIFFGPQTTTELRQIQNQNQTSIVKIQSLCRRYLAKQHFKTLLSDLHTVTMKGTMSVEKRRQARAGGILDKSGETPRRGLSIRKWFHQKQQPKVTNRKVTKRYLQRLLYPFFQKPPPPPPPTTTHYSSSNSQMLVLVPLEQTDVQQTPMEPRMAMSEDTNGQAHRRQASADSNQSATSSKLSLFRQQIGSLLSVSSSSSSPLKQTAVPNVPKVTTEEISTDEEMGIAASLTKLTSPDKQPQEDPSDISMEDTSVTAPRTPIIALENEEELSHRLSLRLSADATSLSQAFTSMSPQTTIQPAEKEEIEEETPAMSRLRSLRSRRQNRPPSGQSQGELSTYNTRRRFKPTQATPSTNGKKTKPLGKMGALQLDRMTKLNTRRNSTYVTCKVIMEVEERDGDRPPSPSLVMQKKAQERRQSVSEMTGQKYNSIYSSEEEQEESEEDDDVVWPLQVDTYSLVNEEKGEEESDNPVASSDTITVQQQQPQEEETTKRKSIEVPVDDTQEDAGKKQCICKSVHWGTKSILQSAWILGLKPTMSATPLKPILIKRPPLEPEPPQKGKKKMAASNLRVVRVACIEYPNSTVPLDEDEEDLEEEEEDEDEEFIEQSPLDEILNEEEDEDEYVPLRRSTRVRNMK